MLWSLFARFCMQPNHYYYYYDYYDYNRRNPVSFSGLCKSDHIHTHLREEKTTSSYELNHAQILILALENGYRLCRTQKQTNWHTKTTQKLRNWIRPLCPAMMRNECTFEALRRLRKAHAQRIRNGRGKVKEKNGAHSHSSRLLSTILLRLPRMRLISCACCSS